MYLSLLTQKVQFKIIMIPFYGSCRLDFKLLEVYFLKLYLTFDSWFLEIHDIEF